MNIPVTPPVLPPYQHTPLFPLGKDRTLLPQARHGRASASKKSSAATCWWSSARRCARWRRRPSPTSIICCGPPSGAAAQDPRRPGSVRRTTSSWPTTSSRTPISPPAACCRCARTPAPPSSWARRAGSSSPTASDEAALGRGRARRLSQAQPALFAARAGVHVRGEEHQVQHAGAGRDLCRRRRRGRRRLQVSVHRQGRRLRQQVVPLPGDAVDPHPRSHAGVPQGEDPHARHRGLSAVSPRHRDRRNLARS